MTKIFITGLSGVGKSSVLNHLKEKGYPTFDLDYGYIIQQDGEPFIDEEKVFALINNQNYSHLLLAGTESNQGVFYNHVDYIILLEAPLETMLERIKTRTTNPYGKEKREREAITNHYYNVLPLLRKRATLMIDTSVHSIEAVSNQIEQLLKK